MEGDAEPLPPLMGWLYKLGNRGLMKTYKWRFFVYDDYTGYLNYYKSNDAKHAPMGYVDIAACRSIETTDPELKRFKLNLPKRTWILMSSGPEETIFWMEQLLSRKGNVKQRDVDHSKEEIDEDDWEFIPNSALQSPGTVQVQ